MHAPASVTRWDFPVGKVNDATIAIVADSVRRARLSPRLRARARSLFSGLDGFDTDGEIARVYDWTRSAVRYQRDPIGVEHLTEPEDLDRDIDAGDAAEDCDGIAQYAAALLTTAGHRVRYVGIGFNPSEPDRLHHLALEVLGADGKWIPFDATAGQKWPGFPLGATVHRAGAPIRRWNADGQPADDQGARKMARNAWDAAFGDVDKNTVQQIIRGITGIAGGIVDAVMPEAGGAARAIGQQSADAYARAAGMIPIDPYTPAGQSRPPIPPPPASPYPPPAPYPGPYTAPPPARTSSTDEISGTTIALGLAGLGAIALLTRRRGDVR